MILKWLRKKTTVKTIHTPITVPYHSTHKPIAKWTSMHTDSNMHCSRYVLSISRLFDYFDIRVQRNLVSARGGGWRRDSAFEPSADPSCLVLSLRVEGLNGSWWHPNPLAMPLSKWNKVEARASYLIASVCGRGQHCFFFFAKYIFFRSSIAAQRSGLLQVWYLLVGKRLAIGYVYNHFYAILRLLVSFCWHSAHSSPHDVLYRLTT